VLLDRDGTLNREVHYLSRPQDLSLLPSAGDAVARLRDAGYAVAVITNQSAIARGLLAESTLDEIHCELRRQLAAHGADLDGIYHCPHHPDFGDPPYRANCACRKPKPGMILRAAHELGLDLGRSLAVGDKLSDLHAGWNAGCRSALVLTGYGEAHRRMATPADLGRAALIGRNLGEVADWVLEQPWAGVLPGRATGPSLSAPPSPRGTHGP